MREPFCVWAISIGLLLGGASSPAWSVDANQLIRLLETRSCQACRLQDADLAQADLRDAKLKSAQLQRANLSGSRLDGADLRGANLSFTSLAGASLRGTDLRGSDLNGTDLRQADLSGALLDPGALSRTYWDGALGIEPYQHSYTELHNAGVRAAQAGRYPEAERFLDEAIRRNPDAAISWMSRGITRSQLGKKQLAANDLKHAADLYREAGDIKQAEELAKASTDLEAPAKKTKSGTGIGMSIINGAATTLQILAPLAIKAFIPAGL